MRKNWPLIAILIIFTAPFIGATYLLYYQKTNKTPTKQHGVLVQPAQKIDHPLVILRKWNVIYASIDDTQTFSNLHLALGKDQDRVNVIQSNWQKGAAIVDPNGLYILHYSDPVDASGLLKDLRRLLKYSHAY